MKLKTAVLTATLLATCCCALPAHAKAAKPKKSTTASGNTLTTAQFMSGWSSATMISGSLSNTNSDQKINSADLQALLNILKSGRGSTSTVTSSDINSDGLFGYTNSSSSLEMAQFNPNPANLVAIRDPGQGTSPVPEPASVILAGCGLVVLLAARRRLQAG